MDTYEEYVKALEEEAVLFGKNDEGEDVVIQMVGDVVKTLTFQNNGWTCTHYIHKDGIVEELFSK